MTANKLPYKYLIVLCLVILAASLCFLFTHIFLSIWWIDEPLHFAGKKPAIFDDRQPGNRCGKTLPGRPPPSGRPYR